MIFQCQCPISMTFVIIQKPKMITWELKARQMGLQKKELSEMMVHELELACTPEMYLQETEKLHHELFSDVSI